jgi:hypothetical protein
MAGAGPRRSRGQWGMAPSTVAGQVGFDVSRSLAPGGEMIV